MTRAPASAQARRGRLRRHLPPLVLLLLPAVLLFTLAYDNGGYSLASRASWAILVWWVLVLGAVVGWWRRGLDRSAALVAGALAGFALVTLASGVWGPSWEHALVEFDRVTLYLGVFLLAAIAPRATWTPRLCDGVAVGIVSVLAVALLSRFVPDLFSDRGAAEALPTAVTRLSFPVGYWNGLAILAALAVPLLLRLAASKEHVAFRAIAVGALPVVPAVAYLASSRGGFAVAAVAGLSYLILAERRWWVAAALVAAGTASMIGLRLLSGQTNFVNVPESPAAAGERTDAALAVTGSCTAAALAFGVLVVYLRGRPGPSRTRSRVAAAVAALAALAAIVAIEPVERARAFTRPPAEAQVATDDFVRSHILSANGSGRWQFWETAVDAFRDRPVVGRGAGTYEDWWAERGSLQLFVRDAHSLYLETAAELGLVGLAFLLVVGVGLLGFVRASTSAAAADRSVAAAGLAVFVAFAAGAAIDWIWELPAVGLVAFASLGFAAAAGPRRAPPTFGPRFGALVAFALAGWVILCAQTLPFLTDLRILASQEAARRGDLVQAAEAARGATATQPWAASPWLQLGLVREQQGELSEAQEALERAVDRNPRDWRLWLAAARIQTRVGDVEKARESLRRARELNPRSPLFRRLE